MVVGSEIVCEIRYQLDPERLPEFEDYARAWMTIIERHGGRHLGFFLPRGAPGSASFSFPGLGAAGDPNQAVALYSFPDDEAYQLYRAGVPRDLQAASVIERFSNPPFERYERLFMSSIPRSPEEQRLSDRHGC